MDQASLFQSTVPVFRHYLSRIDDILARLGPDATALLESRLAPDMFTAGEQFGTAQGFVVRTVFPLIGYSIPALSTEDSSADSLRARSTEVRRLLDGVTEEQFAGAAARTIHHVAGQAELEQTGADFATLYALPNFFFHLCMGYAILRQRGVTLGKGDFDGHHRYAAGFSF